MLVIIICIIYLAFGLVAGFRDNQTLLASITVLISGAIIFNIIKKRNRENEKVKLDLSKDYEPFVTAVNETYKNRKKRNIMYTICGAILGIGGQSVLLYAICSSFLETNVGIWLFSTVLALLGSLLVTSKSSNLQVYRDIALRFYNECKKEKIDDLEDPVNFKRAQMIFRKDNLCFVGMDIKDTIQIYYQQGLLMANSDNVLNDIEKTKQERVRENTEKAKLDKYLNLVGNAKALTMIKERRAELGPYESITTYQKMLQHKGGGDWAVNGGIASAIGGVGAGISSALQTQQKNAEAQAYNQAHAGDIAMAANFIAGDIEGRNRERSRLDKMIEQAPYALVDDTASTNDIHALIKVISSEATVTATGAVRAKVTIQAIGDIAGTTADKLPVYDTVDGFLYARLYQNGKSCGTANLTLPMSGLTRSRQTSVEGLCTDLNDPNATYEVIIEPNKLWIMESISSLVEKHKENDQK